MDRRKPRHAYGAPDGAKKKKLWGEGEIRARVKNDEEKRWELLKKPRGSRECPAIKSESLSDKLLMQRRLQESYARLAEMGML